MLVAAWSIAHWDQMTYHWLGIARSYALSVQAEDLPLQAGKFLDFCDNHWGKLMNKSAKVLKSVEKCLKNRC